MMKWSDMLYVNVFSYLSGDDIMMNVVIVNRYWLHICQGSSLLWKQIGYIHLNGNSYVNSFEKVIPSSLKYITSLGLSSHTHDECDTNEMTRIIKQIGSSLRSLTLNSNYGELSISDDPKEKLFAIQVTTLSHIQSLKLKGDWMFVMKHENKRTMLEWSLPSLTRLDFRMCDSDAHVRDPDHPYVTTSFKPFALSVFHQLRALILSGPVTCEIHGLPSIVYPTKPNMTKRYALPLLQHFIFDNNRIIPGTNPQMALFCLWLPSLGNNLQTLALRWSNDRHDLDDECQWSNDFTHDPTTWPLLQVKQWPLLHTLAMSRASDKNYQIWYRLAAHAHPSLHHLIIDQLDDGWSASLWDWCSQPSIISFAFTGHPSPSSPHLQRFVHQRYRHDHNNSDAKEFENNNGSNSNGNDDDNNNVVMIDCIARASGALVAPRGWIIGNTNNMSSQKRRNRVRNKKVLGRVVHHQLPRRITIDQLDRHRYIHNFESDEHLARDGIQASVRSEIPVSSSDDEESFIWSCHTRGIWLQFSSFELLDLFSIVNHTDKSPFFDIDSIIKSPTPLLSSSVSSIEFGCPITVYNEHALCACSSSLPKVAWHQLHLHPVLDHYIP
jgi:hypothetical protein